MPLWGTAGQCIVCALYQSGFHQRNRTGGTYIHTRTRTHTHTHIQVYCAISPQQKRNTYNLQLDTKSSNRKHTYIVCECVYVCLYENIYLYSYIIYMIYCKDLAYGIG